MRSKTTTLFTEKVAKPKISNKFGSVSIYYKKVYYFPSDIKPSNKRDGKPYEIQAVFHDGKYRQDTFYITQELKDLLLTALN